MKYPLSQPSIGSRELDYARSALDSGWISGSGGFIGRLESALCAVTGRDFALATSSGTSALEVLLQGLGIGAGDEVIVPALTFAAPAAAVVNCGATPILCDVTEETWTIDVAMACRLLNSRTKAIIAVNIMGHPCDFELLEKIGVFIIEDAAESHGSAIGDRLSGSFGVASIFSFHANKVITSGEGGAILSDDRDLMDRCRLIANHGMSPDVPYVHTVAGRNARLNNISAAIGLGQMERWEELTSAREKVFEIYKGHLDRVVGVSMRPVAPWAKPSCWLACFSVDDVANVVGRARGVGVDVRRVWPALSSLPLYHDSVVEQCVVAEEIAARSAWLPTWSHMEPGEVLEVVNLMWPEACFL